MKAEARKLTEKELKAVAAEGNAEYDQLIHVLECTETVLDASEFVSDQEADVIESLYPVVSQIIIKVEALRERYRNPDGSFRREWLDELTFDRRLGVLDRRRTTSTSSEHGRSARE